MVGPCVKCRLCLQLWLHVYCILWTIKGINVAYDFGVKLSLHACVATLAALTGERAGICDTYIIFGKDLASYRYV